MSTVILKNISRDNLLEEYLNTINSRCEQQMPIVKKINKMVTDDYFIPSFDKYNELIYNNYNVSHLKEIARFYKIKITGNKGQLITRLYIYLYLSNNIIKIQKKFRMFLVKQYLSLRGPAVINRKICTNANDFITMEPLEEITIHQFISYKDIDGFIYGFDINSLQNLFLKTETELKNPYNRNKITSSIFKNIRSLIRISKILNYDINLNYNDDIKNVTADKAIELKAVSLFQNINALGNYADVNWFLSLNRISLLALKYHLRDIWNYRSQITSEIKRNICPPRGNIDRYFCNISDSNDILEIKNNMLVVLEKLVNSGIDKESKTLGSYYVLGALTIVSDEAASALPWLFQAFSI